MEDTKKTKQQLIKEASELRWRVAELEASDARCQIRLHDEVHQRLMELTAVHGASLRLQQLHPPATLAQEIIHMLQETLAYEYGAVLLLELGTGRLLPFALADQGRGPEFVEQDKAHLISRQLRLGLGISGWVAEVGQSVRVGDVRQDPRYFGVRPDIRSELCVPLRVGDEILGVVNVETTRTDAYTEGDQRVLETVAAQMAVAIQNARLYEKVQRQGQELEEHVRDRTAELREANEQLRRRNRDLNAFYEVGQTLTRALDIQAVYRVMFAEVGQKILNSPHFLIAKLADAGETVYCDYAVVDGKEMDQAEFPPMALGQGPTSDSFRTRQPQIVDMARIAQWVDSGGAVLIGDDRCPRSAMYVPLMSADRFVGVMVAQSYEAQAYRDIDMSLVTTLAGQAAIALENARLYEQAQRELADRKRAELELAQRLRETTLLHQTSILIAQAPDLTQALSDVCAELARFLGVPQAGFALLNAERSAAQVIADYRPPGSGSALGTVIPVAGNPSMVYILEKRAPLAIDDAQADPRLSPVHDVMRHWAIQSILIVPIVADGEVIGTLGFDAFERRTFRQADIDLVQNVANQLGQALVRKRAEDALQRHAREMAALYETSLEINSQPDLSTLLYAIVDRAAELVGVPMGGLYLMRPGEEALELVAHHSMPRDYLGSRLGLGEGLSGRVAETGRPMMVADYHIWEGRSELYADPAVRRALAVPLKVGNHILGALDLSDDKEVGLFDDNQVRLASLFADQAAIAVENARLLEAERTAREQTEALREAARAMGASLELNETLRLILDQLRRVLLCDSASLLVLRDGDEPDLMASLGYEDVAYTSREAGRLLRQSPILRRMAKDLQPVVSEDVRRLDGWVWVPGAEHVRSWMGIPLVAHGRMIGALMADHSQSGFYGEAELRLAQALAQHAAQALENAQLFELRARAEREAQERRLYLEAVLASAPDAIVTLDARDRLVEWNAGAERLFGYSREEAVGKSIDDLITNADTLEGAIELSRLGGLGQHECPTEAIRFRKDGSAVDVMVACSPILRDEERIGRVGVYTNIGERKQAERALRHANRGLQMLSRCNEVLSRAREELQLLEEICQIAVVSGGYRLAWVGFAEHDEAKSVRPVAQAGYEEGYLETVRIAWADTARGRGPTGTAIRTGRPAISRDMLTDPNYAPWRQDALRRGFASSIALPLLVDGQPLGALNIYAPEADAFDAEEANLLTELADNLAYGILALRTRAERARAEIALQRYAERLETLHQIDRAIVEAQSPVDIAQAALARIGRLVPCHTASITAFDARSDLPIVLAVHVRGEPPLPGASDHASADRVAAQETAHAEVKIPLLAEGELVGTLRLSSDGVDAFTREQVEIVYEIVPPLAFAIEHARLRERLRQYAGSLEETVAQRTRELQAERDRTQAILESLGEAIIVTDVDGLVLYSNPACAALTGYSMEEALGQNWQMLQGDAQFLDQVYRQAQEAMRAHQTWRGEMVNRRKDDSSYDVAIISTPLFAPDDAGQLVGSVWVQRDITPLKEADRFKDQFVSNVSHELRTPLSIVTLVVGNLDRLYDSLGDDRRRQMIHSVREQVRVLNDLIDDVLEISRIDSQKISLARQQVDLAELVRAEVQKQEPLARRKSLALYLGGAQRLVTRGNEGQLRQVIRNLLNNAIKFTPNGGQITCECLVQEGAGDLGMAWPGGEGLPAGRWAALRVVDTGIGIDTEDISRLFQRFYRVKTQGNIPGTGLGLAITRELVELHNGYVAVSSIPGEGSTFAVYLPLGGGG